MRLPACFAAALCIAAMLVNPTLAQDAPGGAFKDGWNTWSETKVGDYVQYRLAAGLTVTYELKAIAADGTLTIEIANFSAEGGELSRREIQRSADKAPVQAKAPGAEIATLWGTAEYEMADIKLPCDTVTWTGDKVTGSTWFSRSVPCGGVVKSGTDGADTVWLVGFVKDGKEYALTHDEPEPEPVPEPDREPLPDALAGYGDPIAMGLPEKVRKQMQDQGTAITRMRLYFKDDSGAEDGVSLEYEGMYTEVPIIYAAFDTDRCDKALSYKDWLARDGRFVDLGFDIKTRPKTLKGMEVKIEHSHLQGETETTLSTFAISKPEPGDPWESLRLRGARPGINRYTLIVTYTDSKKQQSEQRGFSHWVIVAAPPMFEFLNQATGVATQTQAGGLTLLDAEVRLDGSFLLHHGLNAADCTLRISKRGKREFNLDALPADVRRAIERDATPLGWQELGRCELSGGTIAGRRAATVEDSFVKITFKHAFAAATNVLPVTEDWEYRFELHHKGTHQALATWTANISLKINKPDEVGRAKLKVTATGMAEPLLVPFERK